MVLLEWICRRFATGTTVGSYAEHLRWIPWNSLIRLDTHDKNFSGHGIPCLWFPEPHSGLVMLCFYNHVPGTDLGFVVGIHRHMRDQYQANVLCVEYPGCGLLAHVPFSENNIRKVALTVMRHLVDETDLTYDRILVFGDGIGSWPAMTLAAQYPFFGLCVTRAWDTHRSVISRCPCVSCRASRGAQLLMKLCGLASLFWLGVGLCTGRLQPKLLFSTSVGGAVLKLLCFLLRRPYSQFAFDNLALVGNADCPCLFSDAMGRQAHSLMAGVGSRQLFLRCRARKKALALQTGPYRSHGVAEPMISFFGLPTVVTKTQLRLSKALNNAVTSFGECPVCMDSEATHSISPCRHAFCGRCLETIRCNRLATQVTQVGKKSKTKKDSCPLCRQDIHYIVELQHPV
eukprot:TRINITY_DN73436_c0_g1_i1.p1 TRINITY_DN73436_c0_g1~~TRINITY_DN73436_c0_g1_i1.p1  ORF type:complete len:401 (+),score=18.98 TRINITY_DN73436_c0_g1_i1:205-1407(+)